MLTVYHLITLADRKIQEKMKNDENKGWSIRWSIDQVHKVVRGPGPQGWSMDLGPCFVYVANELLGTLVVNSGQLCAIPVTASRKSHYVSVT